MGEKVLFKTGFLSVSRDEESGHEIVDKVGNKVVTILVHLKDYDEVVFVEQRRAPMVSAERPDGIIKELPAGHIEVGETPEQTIKKELYEEIGLLIDEEEIVFPFGRRFLAVSPGWLREEKLFAFVEVDSSRLAEGESFGNRDEGETTYRSYVAVCALEKLEWEDISVMLLIQWFLRRKVRWWHRLLWRLRYR